MPAVIVPRVLRVQNNAGRKPELELTVPRAYNDTFYYYFRHYDIDNMNIKWSKNYSRVAQPVKHLGYYFLMFFTQKIKRKKKDYLFRCFKTTLLG